MIDVDALIASTPPEVLEMWGVGQRAALTLTPLKSLPPADAGIVAAIGPPEAHDGRKWHLCGAVGGVMRKLGFPRGRCEAVIREWLANAGAECNVAAGVKHALGAWSKPADVVSGEAALAQLVGAEHAAVIAEAAMRTRRPRAAIVPNSDDAPSTDVFAPAVPEAPAGAYLDLDRTRQGTPRPSLLNACKALEAWFGERIQFDECRGRVIVRDVDESLGRFPTGLWTDVHTTAFRILAEQHGLALPKDVAVDAVVAHAHEYSHNPLTSWLVECAEAWDGVARVDQALATYWRASDSAAVRACSRVFFLSLAARGLEPGCKVDTALALIGGQGLGKTRSLIALAGGMDLYSGSSLPIGDKDGMQNLRGKWLWEIGENSSFSRRDANAVKAFLDQQFDTFRASYGRFSEDVPRQTCFAVTANHVEILNDPTGARRWLPVTLREDIDVAGIARDRAQLFGEAAARVLGGEEHWPTLAERQALAPVHEHHTEHDPWEELIADWTARMIAKHGPNWTFRMCDVFSAIGPVPLADAQIDRKVTLRVATCARRLGWERAHTRDGKRWSLTRAAQ